MANSTILANSPRLRPTHLLHNIDKKTPCSQLVASSRYSVPAFSIWRVFALWRQKKRWCNKYKGFFGGKNGPKSPYLDSELLLCRHIIGGNPKFSTSLFYPSPNLAKSSCGRSPTQLLHTFEKNIFDKFPQNSTDF